MSVSIRDKTTGEWVQVAGGTGEIVNAVTDGDMRAVTSNAVYDAITNLTPVDVVQSGNMRAVTSNAVAAVNMDSAMSIDTTKWATAGQVHAFKVGQLGIIIWGGYALVDISTDVNNCTKVAQLPVGFRPNIAVTGGTLMTIGGTVAKMSINVAGEILLCCPLGTLKTYTWAWGQIVFAIVN